MEGVRAQCARNFEDMITRFHFTLGLRVGVTFTLCLGALGLFAQDPTVGLLTQTEQSFDGYTLMPVNPSLNTYLLNNCGEVVHQWTSAYRPGMMAYLMPDGDLMRAGRVNNPVFGAGGTGGVIERFSWEGDLEWSCWLSSDTMCQHHDFAVMPNGNVLALLWKSYPASDWVERGRDPDMTAPVVWATCIQEIEPAGSEGGNVVWQWEAIDHVVQHFNENRPNYHEPSTRPRQIDVNYATSPNGKDWLHANSIDYNPELDQIMVSSRGFSEIWFIDHGIAPEETSTTAGDLLYRWGNPEAYGRGTPSDRTLYKQHDAHWLDNGQVMTFSNGNERPEGDFSTVERFTPAMTPEGTYPIDDLLAWGPVASDWRYPEVLDPDFYAQNTSGAQLLPNGNVLITEGNQGDIREVDAEENIVWRYINPVTNQGALPQGAQPTNNGVFHANRYAANHPALAGASLPGLGVLEITNFLPFCTLFPEEEGTCPVDLSGNQLIDVADLLLVLADFGCNMMCDSYLDEDGSVSVSDILALLAQFGQSCS